MHTFVKIVNGYKIKHWTLGNIYYISDGDNWIVENESLSTVEEFANSLQSQT